MRKFFVVLLLAALAVSSVFGARAPVPARAAAEPVAFDYTDVLDDLEGSTDGQGNVFDIADYPKDETGTLRLYLFTEYGYSYAANRRGNYGLYLYLYNPAGTALDTSSPLNRAQMATEYDAEGDPTEYEKFELQFCNRSTGDYNHLFYKFKVKDSEWFLPQVAAAGRRYTISGVEVREKDGGAVKEYGVGGIYTFTGYAAGYGMDAAAGSTLRCSRTDLETVALDVQSTYYRYPTTTTTATQLVSAYFAIDNDLIEKYGKLYAILAEWWEYELAPVIVLKEEELYELCKPWEGMDLTAESTPDTPAYIMTWYDISGGDTYYIDWYTGKGWTLTIVGGNYVLTNAEAAAKLVNLFTSSGADAREYTVTGEDLERHMQEYTAAHGAGSGYKGYNDDLFVGGDGYKRVETTSEDLFDLEGFDMGSGFLNWWYDLIWGYDNEPIEGIEPIHAVTQSDLNASDIADELLIAEGDVEEFKAYCNAQMAEDKTVYLFRYATSEYKEKQAVSVPTGVTGGWEVEYNNSVRWQTVYLGFDIIQLTFRGENGTLTVLPAVADPIDVIPDSDGMGGILDSVNDDGPDVWVWIVIALAALLVLIIVIAILKKVNGPRQPYKGSPEQSNKNIPKKAQKEGNQSASKMYGNTGGKAPSKTAGKTGSGKAVGKTKSRKK